MASTALHHLITIVDVWFCEMFFVYLFISQWWELVNYGLVGSACSRVDVVVAKAGFAGKRSTDGRKQNHFPVHSLLNIP